MIKAKHNIDERIKHAERRAKNIELHDQRRKDTLIANLQNEYISYKEHIKAHPRIPQYGEFRARKRTIKAMLQGLGGHKKGLPQ